MKSLGKLLFIFSLFAACGVAAWFLAPLLEVSFKIALLVAMIVAYLLLSAYLELYRYRLRKHVERMAVEERVALSELDPGIRYSIPAAGSASPRITTLVGAIAVNGPVIPLMVGPLALLQYVFNIHDPLALALSLALGFVLAWAWWSVGVTVWRWWATSRRGMPPGEVQWRGEEASLLWPENHFFEKTELGKLLSRRRAS
jgi:cation transporter-like permease